MKWTKDSAYIKMRKKWELLEEQKEHYADAVISSLERDYFKKGYYDRKAGMSPLSKIEVGVALKRLMNVYADYRQLYNLYKKLKAESEK